MAREESDREDLLLDATALVERIEFASTESRNSEHVVLGFRADGAMSIYFGTDPVYHFNRKGELRRAFCQGRLVKAEKERLVSMRRLRLEREVVLLRHDLNDEEQSGFLSDMQTRLCELKEQCTQKELVTVGQVPADADIIGRAMQWLADHNNVRIACSPHAR